MIGDTVTQLSTLVALAAEDQLVLIGTGIKVLLDLLQSVRPRRAVMPALQSKVLLERPPEKEQMPQ